MATNGAAELPHTPGSYVLVMRSERTGTLAIGKLGLLPLRRGWYLYAGSAFGPGGLAARVGRHLRRGKRLRWHVDYLREAVTVKEVWFTDERNECAWAAILAKLPNATPAMHRFGASDCHCPAHLWYFPKRPSWREFRPQTATCARAICG